MMRLLSTAALLLGAAADIHKYEDKVLQAPYVYYHSGGQYAPQDAPAKYSPGDGRSFIAFQHLKLERRPNTLLCPVFSGSDGSFLDQPCYNADKPALVEIAVMEQSHFDRLGVQVGKDTFYCCTSDAIQAGACEAARKGRMIFSGGEADLADGPYIKRTQVWVPSAEQVAAGTPPPVFSAKDTRYHVRRTGYYNLFLGACDETAGDVVVNGHTEWMNPWGYLPGTEWGNLPFFGSMSLIYLVLGLLWTVLMVCYVKELLPVQAWISLVLLLAMIETAAKFFSYNIWNGDGTRDTGGLVFAMLAGVCKQALSRVLVLLVSTGYGVVKPSLGGMLPKILILGALYFVFALALELLGAVPAEDVTLGTSAWLFDVCFHLVTFSCSLVDVTFYMWVLQELQNTINFLSRRRQELKLRLFRRFRAVLFLSVVFATAWALTTVILAPTKKQPWLHWKTQWALDAVWEVCYAIVCIAICILWRPSANMQRYAYSMQIGGDDSDDEAAKDTGVGIEMEKADRTAEEDDDEEYGGALEDLLPSANVAQGGSKMS